MTMRSLRPFAGANLGRKGAVASCLALLLAPARAETTAGAALPRVEVRVARVAETAADVVLTGDVQARRQSEVAFRIDGKISERLVEVGARIGMDEVLAKLDPDQQRSDLRNAEAALSSAEAGLAQAKVAFGRQAGLMKGRFTTRGSYDQAEQSLRTTQAQALAARAQVGSAAEQLAYADLRAGVAGIVTARSAEVGQVVKAGEAVFTVAQDGPRDAVFNVHETLLATPPGSKQFSVVLQGDPSVKALATVREISPTVDPATGTVKVKASLADAPSRMTLGATVVGIGNLQTFQAVTLPWSALFRWQDEPAVWVVDPRGNTVSPRRITIERYASGGMVLKGGIAAGDRVVTAGI